MLPPFARDIVRARDAGKHPEVVSLIFGTTWAHREYRLSPAVVVLADEFAQGRYEFWWLAGLAVRVINHDCTASAVWPLVLEVAKITAPVLVDDPSCSVCNGGVVAAFADEYACYFKWSDPALAWPEGWSAEIESEYLERETRWARAAGVPGYQPVRERA